MNHSLLRSLTRLLVRESALAEGDDLESYREHAVESLAQQKWLLSYAESVLRRKVLEVAVVGSILRPGRFTESSDADVAFSVAPLAPGEGGLDEELSQELQQALVQDPIDPVGVVNGLVFVGPIATRDGRKLTIAKAFSSDSAQIVREGRRGLPRKNSISSNPVTLKFETETGGFSVVANHPSFKKSVGLVTVIPYWDDYSRGNDSILTKMIKGYEVEIYAVSNSWLDKRFRGEGLGKLMYKFMISNLSQKNIALVPAEWVDTSLLPSITGESIPVGERGTSHDALRVWKDLDVPAFYPEWNSHDFDKFQSVRRRGWSDAT